MKLISKNHFRLLLLIPFLFVLSHVTKAQDFGKNSPYQLVYIGNKDNNVYITVNFVDTSTNKVITTFDLPKNNPYNKLNYPSKKGNSIDNTNKTYNFEKVRLDKIVLPEGKLVLKKNLDRLMPDKGLSAWSFYQASISGKFLVVIYRFYVNWGEDVVGRSDVVYIFDNKGNILHKLENFDTDVSEWAITENGRYFSYGYGDVEDESLDNFSDVGYKILDMKNNKIAYEENFGDKYSEIRTRNVKNMVKITCFSINNRYIFIDFDKNKKYSRIFSNEEDNLWQNITDEGVIMYVGNRNSNKLKLLRFKDDFKVEDIK